MRDMSRTKTQKYLVLMLLIFAGQTVAMPFLDCCVDSENTSSDTQEITGHHEHNDITMSDHHPSEITFQKHDHADEANCNHQCDVCLGTVLLGEFTAFATQITPGELNELYHFILPTSSTDNPFRPPIFT